MNTIAPEIQERIILFLPRACWIETSRVCQLWNEILKTRIQMKPHLELLQEGDLFSFARRGFQIGFHGLKVLHRDIETVFSGLDLETMKKIYERFSWEVEVWDPILRAIFLGGHKKIIRYWLEFRQVRLPGARNKGFYGFGGKSVKKMNFTQEILAELAKEIQLGSRYWYTSLI